MWKRAKSGALCKRASKAGNLWCEKEEGALVMDLGGGVTEYVLCSKGIVSHSGLLAVGGDHVTQDLATGLKCSFDRAEDLKRKYGAALVDEGSCGKIREISNETGLMDYRVEVETLQKIRVTHGRH